MSTGSSPMVSAMVHATTPGPLQLPLHRTPRPFRWFLLITIVLACVGSVWAASGAPGPSLDEVWTEPGFIGLLLLIVLADLYPWLSRMQGVPGVESVVVSAPLSIAALMAYGPPAAVLFLLSGLLCGLRRRWWRVVLNGFMWGLQGVVAALVLVALGSPQLGGWTQPADPGVWTLIAAGVLLLVVVEAVNILLIGLAYVLIGQQTIREYLAGCLEGRLATMIGLIAPVGAVAALQVPWLLPLIAVATIGSLEAVRTAWVRTVLAGTDPLTGAANRAALMARLRTQLARLDRTHHRVAVLLVDLDGFKAVNDEFGHVVGDQVLIEVADRLGTVTRAERDMVARFGGDEFAVLLGGGPLPSDGRDPADGDVDMITERIRTAIAAPMRIGPHRVVVGASVGRAEATSPADQPADLFERADAELYATKAARVCPNRLRTAVPDADDPTGWSGPLWTSTPAAVVVTAPALPAQRTG
ncbi:GGDEF domain-containing protein [Nakamurella flavida]|uniref:GGDEF domain-containing protein n=1 Tax=Nakamurella flavida TaxID=363630 RepID=A0A938YQT3_9ACTN|nr:GGDEF domain-containing protein [Nakamurella flavida]MBM9477747.1 GGDEF domain-containing protein [Nakamurella flavida]MDP9779299.1 diguanylate cyclase (GGDEF)-like protein [Nakamurella flavida]